VYARVAQDVIRYAEQRDQLDLDGELHFPFPLDGILDGLAESTASPCMPKQPDSGSFLRFKSNTRPRSTTIAPTPHLDVVSPPL
jgi:hypothetical protein